MKTSTAFATLFCLVGFAGNVLADKPAPTAPLTEAWDDPKSPAELGMPWLIRVIPPAATDERNAGTNEGATADKAPSATPPAEAPGAR